MSNHYLGPKKEQPGFNGMPTTIWMLFKYNPSKTYRKPTCWTIVLEDNIREKDSFFRGWTVSFSGAVRMEKGHVRLPAKLTCNTWEQFVWLQNLKERKSVNHHLKNAGSFWMMISPCLLSWKMVVTLPKFNMEPKNDGFQSRNLLFQGAIFRWTMLNFRRVDNTKL